MYTAAFLLYVIVTAFTPGPNNILAMTHANKYGLRKTMKFTMGVSVGFLAIMLLCSYFNLLLSSYLPKIQLYLQIGGAVYMVFLAYKIITSTAAMNKHQEGEEARFFVSGLLLQFINPNVILYGLTAISTFVIPVYTTNEGLIASSLFLAFIGMLASISWAVFGAMFQGFLHKHRRAFNAVMASLLVYSGISVFI
ncbi:LysE family transporter [Paenibacillus sp. GCM10023252]|uniref:LysE family transporter n=1 Tax=Paenibacillus sp. GCM10023252 TaxID=3252649 RepID=UPI00361D6B63